MAPPARHWPGQADSIEAHALTAGLTMITNGDPEDMRVPRIQSYLPRFRDLPAPDPEAAGGWSVWTVLLRSRTSAVGTVLQSQSYINYAPVRIIGFLAGMLKITDIHRCMRPGRLRKVLDRSADPAIAIHKQHVCRPQGRGEYIGVADGKGLVAPVGVVQVMRDPAAERCGQTFDHLPGRSDCIMVCKEADTFPDDTREHRATTWI